MVQPPTIPKTMERYDISKLSQRRYTNPLLSLMRGALKVAKHYGQEKRSINAAVDAWQYSFAPSPKDIEITFSLSFSTETKCEFLVKASTPSEVLSMFNDRLFEYVTQNTQGNGK